jgi:O-antigen/teichoic acid export membrane protein
MLRQLIKDSTFFSISRYLSLGFGFLRNLLIARFLSPADYGIWVIITLILSYGDQIHFGLRHLGDKEIPFRRGRGEETIGLANDIYGGIMLFSCSTFLILSIVAAVGFQINPATRFGLLLTALVILLEQITRFYYMIMRAHKDFVPASKVESLYEFLRMILVIAGAFWLKFHGALAGLVLSTGFFALYFIKKYRHTYRPRFFWQNLKTLLQLSMPLFVNGLLFMLHSSLDRLAAGTALSKHELGLYGLVALLAAVPFNAVQAIGFVIYPRLSEKFGEHGNVRELERFFVQILQATVYLVPPIVVSLFLTAPCVITGFLPAYREAIPACFVLLPGVFFFALVQLPTSFLIAVEHNRRFITIETATILITALAYLLGMQITRSINGVAAITALGFFLYTTLLVGSSVQILGYSAWSWLKIIGKVYAPLLGSAVIVYITLHFLPFPSTGSFSQSLKWLLQQLLFFAVVYGGFLYWLNRRTGYWNRLRAELAT